MRNTFKIKANECEIGNDFAQGKTQWMWDEHVEGKSQWMWDSNEYVYYNVNLSY
jgi:hypothetical protein